MPAKKKRPATKQQLANLRPHQQRAGEPGKNPTGSNKLQQAKHRIAEAIADRADEIIDSMIECAESGDIVAAKALLASVLPQAPTQEQTLNLTGPMSFSWGDAPPKPKPKGRKVSPKKKPATNGDARLH
jgi:hypothetical protein